MFNVKIFGDQCYWKGYIVGHEECLNCKYNHGIISDKLPLKLNCGLLL